jgi:hypothetical protein
MSKLNELECLISAGNTGVGSCFLDFKNMVGTIVVPKGYEFDVTDPKTTLLAACLNASKALRIYPVWDFEQPNDGSEEATIQSFNTGAKHVVREGFNDWRFQYVAGGLSLHVNVRKFNGNAWDFYFVDSENKIMGIAGSTATKLKAIPSTGGFFWATPWKMNDGSKIAEYILQFVFNVKYSNDLVNFVKCDFDLPSTLYGLQDVTLSGAAAVTASNYNVTAKTKSVGTNLGDLYPAALAAAGMWIAKNGTTGAAVTITGVTYDSVNKYFVIDTDAADPDYPTAGQKMSITLAAPSVLDAAGITGYESTGALVMTEN